MFPVSRECLAASHSQYNLFHLLQGGARGLPGGFIQSLPSCAVLQASLAALRGNVSLPGIPFQFHVVGLTCISPPRLLLPRSPPRSLSLPLSPAQACPGGIHPQVPVPRPLTQSLLSPDPCPGSPSFLLTWITEPISSLAPLQSPFLLPACPPHCCQAEL